MIHSANLRKSVHWIPSFDGMTGPRLGGLGKTHKLSGKHPIHFVEALVTILLYTN